MQTETAAVPAYGYSAECFKIAAALVKGWYQDYSNQNFDRAQRLACRMTDLMRAGHAIGYAHSMAIANIETWHR